jgi:hypothetical protein
MIALGTVLPVPSSNFLQIALAVGASQQVAVVPFLTAAQTQRELELRYFPA